MTQPGNAPKARPSHLTIVDAPFEFLSERLALEGRKGHVLRRIQHMNWDTAIVGFVLMFRKFTDCFSILKRMLEELEMKQFSYAEGTVLAYTSKKLK